jgi:hypothetical protein
MRTRTLTVLALTASTLAGGCAHRWTNNGAPVALKKAPSVKVDRNIETDFSKYATFATVPAGDVDKAHAADELQDRAILFFIRSLMERRGYEWVPLNQNPDLVVTVLAKSEYKLTWIPPQTVILPKYVQGTTITSNTRSSGTYSGYLSGSYSGSSTTTTDIPGYMTTEAVTKPGYHKGNYFPAVRIDTLDGRTGGLAWTGTGVGTSATGDVKISSQLIINDMMETFSSRDQRPSWASKMGPGRTGFAVLIATTNGASYFPYVLEPRKGDPSLPSGVEQWDEIRSVDGVSLENKPYSEASVLLSGPVGSVAKLQLRRLGEYLTVDVKRVASRDN